INGTVSSSIRNRFGSDFRHRCAFYIRGRGLANEADSSSLNRLSPTLDAHIPAIRRLNHAGYQVLLTGDLLPPLELVDELAGGLVDWRVAHVNRDAFSLFAGTEVDIHIGSLSGGSSFLFAADIPGLMLNAFAPGDALPRTTVSYKWLSQPDGVLVAL